ncbi:DnaD domain protein [Blautia sp. 1033sp1_1033st1_G9_1033SCRN_220408]|uniref:DnaD domain protein n=1 Tax=Blautia sp. 1033sp1_1033st1_G9_1033SCRN_220408 TaxID=3144490 RepID=UPI0034A38841
MNTIHLRALSSSQVTILSNIFIDQYMPGAGGEFVKVYIYLLRLLADPSASVCLPLLADRLNCTEGDISRALKYWSNEGLLILETDPSGELTGITLTEPSPDTQMELTATVSVPQSALAATAPISQTVSAATVSTPQPDTAPSRSASALTPARIKELKENEDVAQLIYICEQYLGKTLTPTDTRKILFFYDELKMSVDLIDFLIQYCVGRGHKSMRYIETVAMAWSKEGITTVEMAKDSTSRYGRDYFTILKAMGITNRNPVDSEIVMMDTWLKDYGFSMDMIQEACSRTIMQTGQPSFQYAHKILTGWFKKSALTPEAVHALDVQHQKRSQDNSRGRSQTPKSPNRFNNFQQRNYDFKELEKQLLERQNPYSQQPH